MKLKVKIKSSLLFCLYLIAGFPDIISVGSTVKSLENSGSGGASSTSDNDGLAVVVTHFTGPDKEKKRLIVDFKTRKRKYKGEQLLEVSVKLGHTLRLSRVRLLN